MPFDDNQWPRTRRNSSLDRRKFLTVTGAALTTVLLDGCHDDLFTETNSASIITAATPHVVQPSPPAGTSVNDTRSVTIGTTQIGTLGAGAIGISMEKETLWANPKLFIPGNTTLINLFNNIGPSVLRLCGYSAETCHWQSTGNSTAGGVVTQSMIRNLCQFLALCPGWQLIYGMGICQPYNYGTFNNGKGADPIWAKATWLNPQDAVSEIEYLLTQLPNTTTLQIELGNEPDYYHDRTDVQSANLWSPTEWIVYYQTFASAILDSLRYVNEVNNAPRVTLVGPADAFNFNFLNIFSKDVAAPYVDSAIALTGGSSYETVTVPRAEGFTAYTVHYYRDGTPLTGATNTGDVLVSYPDKNLASFVASWRTNTSSNAPLPLRLGETNCYTGSTANGIGNLYVDCLWALDHAFSVLSYGLIGLNFHTGAGSGGYSAFPWTNEFSTTATPVLSIAPLYYGLLFLQYMEAGSMLATTLSASSYSGDNTSVYTVQMANGGVNLLIVNKNSYNLNISVPAGSFSSGTLLELTNSYVLGGVTSVGAPTWQHLPQIQGTTAASVVAATGAFQTPTGYTVAPSAGSFQFFVPFWSAVILQMS